MHSFETEIDAQACNVSYLVHPRMSKCCSTLDFHLRKLKIVYVSINFDFFLKYKSFLQLLCQLVAMVSPIFLRPIFTPEFCSHKIIYIEKV